MLLSADAVPDHATLGHSARAEARRAGAVLAALEPACADRVGALALDEILYWATDPTWRTRPALHRPLMADASADQARPRRVKLADRLGDVLPPDDLLAHPTGDIGYPRDL